MSENDRLQLIQRAAKRITERNTSHGFLSNGMNPVSPATELIKGSEVLERTDPHLSDPYLSDDPNPPAATTLPDARRARFNFAELRRLGMVTPDNMTSVVSYEYRTIKRKLLANARDPQTHAMTNGLIMITSALPGEGKTFTAVNLAVSLAAERDLHVLLIDGDVVHPSLGMLFEHTGDDGLTDLLSGKCQDISDVLYRCEDLPNMSVIFAGRFNKNTPELLSSRRMAEICLEMSKQYKDRIVIIDTPPVLACAEPANIATHVHQVILVVGAAQATRSQIRAALEDVSACPSVSVLFNKAPHWNKIDAESYYYTNERSAPS